MCIGDRSAGPATSAEAVMSPDRRPESTMAAPKIQIRNRIQVGISDRARSCPRNARLSPIHISEPTRPH